MKMKKSIDIYQNHNQNYYYYLLQSHENPVDYAAIWTMDAVAGSKGFSSLLFSSRSALCCSSTIWKTRCW